MYMLSIFWWYVTQFLHNIYMVFVISDICSLNTPTTWLYVFCSMPWHMSSPDTISNLTVYNGIPRLGIMIPDMIMFDCDCIIIVRRDALSQSILSYGNYTSWRSRLYSYFRSPLTQRDLVCPYLIFCQYWTDDLRIDSLALWPTELFLYRLGCNNMSS